MLVNVCSNTAVIIEHIKKVNKRAQRALERSPETEGLRVPFFHCFMYNRRHLGGLNLKAIVLKFKSNVCKIIFYDLTW